MRLLLILSLFFAFSNIALCQMSATLTVKDKQFLSESFKVEDNYITYSPDAILLDTKKSFDAVLLFEFPYQEKVVNQSNFEQHQLKLEFDYPQELFSIIPDIHSNEKSIQLNFIVGEKEADTALNISIKNNSGTVVAKYHFLFEFLHESFIQASSDVNKLEDRRIVFAEAPLVLKMEANDSTFYYQIDTTTIIIPVEKNSSGFKISMIIDFLNIKEEDLINDLDITLEWLGKGLVLENCDNSQNYFHIKPIEDQQLNYTCNKHIPDKYSMDRYIYTFIPSPTPDHFAQTIIEGIYSMQISLANKETKQRITKNIDFYILE